MTWSDFSPVHHHRVCGLFRSFGYPSAVARHLTGLSTAVTPPRILSAPRLAHRNLLSTRHLPQGAPTSPALANLSAFLPDGRLAGLGRSLGAGYTRYADDLTFSGDNHIAAILQGAVPFTVRKCGFTLNTAKTRKQPANGRQIVTGVVIKQKLNLPREEHDHFRAVIHHLRDPSDTRRNNPDFLHHLAGRISWLEQIKPPRWAKLRERLATTLHPKENL